MEEEEEETVVVCENTDSKQDNVLEWKRNQLMIAGKYLKYYDGDITTFYIKVNNVQANNYIECAVISEVRKKDKVVYNVHSCINVQFFDNAVEITEEEFNCNLEKAINEVCSKFR